MLDWQHQINQREVNELHIYLIDTAYHVFRGPKFEADDHCNQVASDLGSTLVTYCGQAATLASDLDEDLQFRG